MNTAIVHQSDGASVPKSKTDTDTDQQDAAELRRQLEEMKAERDTYRVQAQSETTKRREAEKANMSSQERALVTEMESTDSRIESLEGDLTNLEEKMAAAADEPGNGKVVAQISRQMAAKEAELREMNARKGLLADARTKMTDAHKTAPADDAGGKKLANGLELSRLSPKTQAWCENHPKIFTDIRYAKQAVIAAQEAVDVEGLEDQSAEYFRFIEGKLGISAAPVQNSDDDEEEESDEEGEEIEAATPAPSRESYAPEKPQTRAAGPGSMAAAPSRSVPSGSGGGNRRAPSLTSEEKEVALNLYSHLNISDADKLKRYADAKKYMKDRPTQHFRGMN